MTNERSLFRVVTYVLRDAGQFGLKPGYCVMGMRPAHRDDVKVGRMLHRLKCWPEFYDAVESEEKGFEIRKDDRDPRFAVGDLLELERTPAVYDAPTENK